MKKLARLSLLTLALATLTPALATASTYVVQLPLNSPIYTELETLQGAGILDTYLDTIKPISRMEAARLALEAEHNLAIAEKSDTLSERILHNLRIQLREEIGWLEKNREDSLPTMIHPVDRVEAQFVYSRGPRRRFFYSDPGLPVSEGTPMLPNNNDIPTAGGSNEVIRASGWGGFGSFLTAYGEGSVAGPLTYPATQIDRMRLLRGEVVASLGNTAISFGQQEMAWGTGHFSSLSQSNNAQTFPALRIQNIHPFQLPGLLRYLGPARLQGFFGQLDHNRVFSRPWISGQVLSLKPLPTFEFGLTHVIMFGGRYNSDFGPGGFIGRATGFNTGSAITSNTNSRAGVFLKFYFPKLRNTVVYQEVLGEDNLTTEFRPVGRFMPFLAVSYQGGIYVPRLTADGLTTARFEYTILEPNYSTHSDSLYWTYKDRMMGDWLGPNSSRVDIQIGRWIKYRYKVDLDIFYTERAPGIGVPGRKERSGGFTVDVLRLADGGPRGSLFEIRARAGVEYVNNINFASEPDAVRAIFSLTGGLTPSLSSLEWR